MGPPLSYLHGKKLTPVRSMNSDSMNIANSFGIFNDSAAMNSVIGNNIGMNSESCA